MDDLIEISLIWNEKLSYEIPNISSNRKLPPLGIELTTMDCESNVNFVKFMKTPIENHGVRT